MIRQSRLVIFILVGLLLAEICSSYVALTAHSLTQPDQNVIIFTRPNFMGRSLVLRQSWPGGGYFEGRVRSIHVPPGTRIRLYSMRNFRGLETGWITNSTSPSAGVWWADSVRSIRIEWIATTPTEPTTTPPVTTDVPFVFAQAGFKGPSQAVDRDWAGSTDWEGSPHLIRSIRVPRGWFLVLYSERNFRGRTLNLDSDWTPQPGNFWYRRIRSIKVYRGKPPTQPRKPWRSGASGN